MDLNLFLKHKMYISLFASRIHHFFPLKCLICGSKSNETKLLHIKYEIVGMDLTPIFKKVINHFYAYLKYFVQIVFLCPKYRNHEVEKFKFLKNVKSYF